MVKNINVFSRETRIWDPKHTTHSIALIYNHTEFVYGLDFNLHVDGQVSSMYSKQFYNSIAS